MAADVSTLPMKGNGAVAVIPSPDKLTAVDVGRMMLERGANPNIQLKRRPPYRDVPQDRGGDGMLAQGATPLLRAARGGDDKFVALLLEYKALVDLPSKEGITPLMAAAGVDYGARVTRGRNRTDEGVLASMDLLIKAGANVNARSLVDRAAGGRRSWRSRWRRSSRCCGSCCSWYRGVQRLCEHRTGLPSRQSNAERERRPEPNRSARRCRTRLR